MTEYKYDLEIERIVSVVTKEKAKIVGLQFPEGLKQKAVEVAREIEEKTGVTTITFIDPTYGACDLKTGQAEKMGVDLLVHFGHNKFKPRQFRRFPHSV